MKRLPFSRRRVAFRVGLHPQPGISLFQAGIVVGHFVARERGWWRQEPTWERYYELEVVSGPSSMVGSRITVSACYVFRWPHVRAS